MLVEADGAREAVAQLLDERVAGPAEPCPLQAAAGDADIRHRVQDVGAYPPGDEDVPPALLDRAGDGAPRGERAPVHGLELGRDADLAQQLGGDEGGAAVDGDVGRLEDDDRAAVVAGFGDEGAGAVEVLRRQRLRPGVGLERGPAAEIGGAGAEIGRVADGRPQVVRLVDRPQHRPAHLRVVERRQTVVQADPTLVAERIEGLDDDSGARLHDRQQVVRRQFEVIHLAGDERVHRRRRIGDVKPFDAVDLRALAAGGEARRLGARRVVRVADVDRLRARNPLPGDEHERPGADGFGHLFERVGLREAGRHHERHVRRNLAERLQDEAVGRLQGQRKGPVVDGLEALGGVHEFLPHAVARAPAPDRGHAIGRRHRRPVVPEQAVAQAEGPHQAVGARRPVLDHLRADLESLVEGEQGVVHHVAVVAADVGGGPDRIEVLQVGVRDDSQRRFAGGGRGGGEKEDCGGRRGPAREMDHGGAPVEFACPLHIDLRPDGKAPRRPRRRGAE